MIVGSPNQALDTEVQACLYRWNTPELIQFCGIHSAHTREQKDSCPEAKFLES